MLLSNFYHRYRMSRRYLLWVLFSGTTQWWGGTTRIIMNLIKLIHEFLSVPTYRRNQTSDSLNRFKLGVNGVSSVCIESITVRPPLVILSLRFNLFYSFYIMWYLENRANFIHMFYFETHVQVLYLRTVSQLVIFQFHI